MTNVTSAKLRKLANGLEEGSPSAFHKSAIVLRSAADRIEALEAELARVREALRRRSIFSIGYGYPLGCIICGDFWSESEAESHNPVSGFPCPAELPKT